MRIDYGVPITACKELGRDDPDLWLSYIFRKRSVQGDRNCIGSRFFVGGTAKMEFA